MPSRTYKVGPGSAAAYQSSGRPYLTGSEVPDTVDTSDGVEISFPSLTKSITVRTLDGSVPIILYFDSRSLVGNPIMNNHHYYVLDNNVPYIKFDIKCNRIYLSTLCNGASGSYCLAAEMTSIEPQLYELSSASLGTTLDGINN
ncbi:hypothetical protein M0R19_04225 [Candidatus Pacearchaeota archaeon]|jgi:hypothetical protein|nr:hypothetical protein [Candidatus Pacearchaeota archaeon]